MRSIPFVHTLVGIAKRMSTLLLLVSIMFFSRRSWGVDGGPGAQGEPCNVNNPCLSNLFCADGYCCNTVCNRGCESCNQKDFLGTCHYVPSGTPGREINNEGKLNCLNVLCDGASPYCRGSCNGNDAY